MSASQTKHKVQIRDRNCWSQKSAMFSVSCPDLYIQSQMLAAHSGLHCRKDPEFEEELSFYGAADTPARLFSRKRNTLQAIRKERTLFLLPWMLQGSPCTSTWELSGQHGNAGEAWRSVF